MVEIDEKRTEDLELMRRVAGADETAVGAFYDRFVALVYRMARQSLPSRCDVDDVVQDVFVLLWRTAARYDPARASLVTWVMLITRRRIVDALRQHRRANEQSLDGVDSPAVASDTTAEPDERFEVVVQRMSTLSDLQRTVLTRAYLGGQPLRQIGKDLNIPLGTIKSALHRSVNTLRAGLARHAGSVAMGAGATAA